MIALIMLFVSLLPLVQQPLDAWSDPNDDREAIYIRAPEDACRVTFNPETRIIIIDFSDACEQEWDID